MSRYILGELDKAGIGIASATYDIVGLPSIEMRRSQEDRGQPNKMETSPDLAAGC